MAHRAFASDVLWPLQSVPTDRGLKKGSGPRVMLVVQSPISLCAVGHIPKLNTAVLPKEQLQTAVLTESELVQAGKADIDTLADKFARTTPKKQFLPELVD